MNVPWSWAPQLYLVSFRGTISKAGQNKNKVRKLFFVDMWKDSSVNTVTKLMTGEPRNNCSIPGNGKIFTSSPKHVRTDFGAYTGYSVGNRIYFAGCQVAEAQISPLRLIQSRGQKRVELQSDIPYAIMMLCLIKLRHKQTVAIWNAWNIWLGQSYLYLWRSCCMFQATAWGIPHAGKAWRHQIGEF